MAARIREHEWAATPLGPIADWPQSLRTTVDLLLPNGFGMVALWGPDLIQLYNDAYRDLMGGKHPGGLGQPTAECWPEVWHINGPIYERVRTGETVTFEDASYPIARSGRLEDAWFALTYSPLRDEAGAAAGILVTVFENTRRHRTEQRLRDSEERFRAFVTASSDVIYRMAPDWSEMRQLDGRGFLADLRTSSTDWLQEYIGPNDQPRVMAAIEEAIRTKTMFELEHRVRRADGSFGWTLSRAVPVLDASGEIREWFGTASDVTARKTAETILQEGEKRQAFLLKLSDALRPIEEPFAIQREACRVLRQQLVAIRVAYAEMRPDGVTCTLLAEDIVGDATSLAGLVFDWNDFDSVAHAASKRGETFSREDLSAASDLTPEQKAAFASLNVRGFITTPLMKAGRLVAFFVAQFEAPRRFGLSEIAMVEETAERTWAAVERARVEAAMRESDARFRTIADNISQLAWTCDKLGDVTWYNKRWLDYTGLSFEDMKDWGWRRVQHPDHVDRVVAGVRTARESGEPWQDTFPLRAKDGTYRWFLSRAFPTQTEAGEVVRWFGTNTDITDLREAHERQQVLVAELQHRTRNLMANVRAMADTTLRASADLEDFEGKFRDRLGSLARVQSLLSRLVETDRITFDELLRTELAAHGALGHEERRVKLEGPRNVPLRSGTVQTLAMALHELATNAIKHGALGAPRGLLAVTWRVAPAETDERPLLHVDWRESGVPMPRKAAAAPGSGQGRELIEKALPYQLKATTTFVLGADGLHCTMVIPISAHGVATGEADARHAP